MLPAEKGVDRRPITAGSNLSTTRRLTGFSGSTYKIYVVLRLNKYKSNMYCTGRTVRLKLMAAGQATSLAGRLSGGASAAIAAELIDFGGYK